MILLALECATSAGSVALCAGTGEVIGCRRGASAPDQADRLVELTDATLCAAGVAYDALDVIAVNHGPGSFTGVRAAVAAARGLALAMGRPVFAVNTLEVLAAALGPQAAGTVVAALDARRGQVYVQVFDHQLVALSAPCALAPEDLILDRAEAPIRLVGHGAALARAALPRDLPVLEENVEADALAVARRALTRLAAGERPVPGHTVQPLYLRAPDARLPQPARVRAMVRA